MFNTLVLLSLKYNKLPIATFWETSLCLYEASLQNQRSSVKSQTKCHRGVDRTSHIRISFTLFKDFIVKATLETSFENVLNTFDMNEKGFKRKTAFSFTKHECRSIQQCRAIQGLSSWHFWSGASSNRFFIACLRDLFTSEITLTCFHSPFISLACGQKGEHRFRPLHRKTEREQQKCACEEMTSTTKEFDRKPAKNIARLALKFERHEASLHGLILIFLLIFLLFFHNSNKIARNRLDTSQIKPNGEGHAISARASICFHRFHLEQN